MSKTDTTQLEQKIDRLAEEIAALRSAMVDADTNEKLDGDERWDKLFADPRSEKLLSQMAAEAKREHEDGNTISAEEYFNAEESV